MKSRFIAFLATLMFALPAWGVAEQLTDTYLLLSHSKQSRTAMVIRCDTSGISGTGGIAGEVCESGDWSRAIDCSDYQHLTVQYWEYGSGNSDIHVWDCQRIAGSTSAGGTKPGEESPSTAPTPGDPDPLCYELTVPAGIDTGTFDGVTNTFMHLSGEHFHFIVAEIVDCTGECDSTLILSCGR